MKAMQWTNKLYVGLRNRKSIVLIANDHILGLNLEWIMNAILCTRATIFST